MHNRRPGFSRPAFATCYSWWKATQSPSPCKPGFSRLFWLFAIVAVAGCASPRSTNTHPNISPLLVTGARIWTGDDAYPEASCLVIKDGTIDYVGNDQSDAAARAGTNAIYHNANGARIIPGMIDAHLHLISGGLQLSRLQLREVPDRAAFVAAIAGRAKKTPKGEWILGGRWSTESWPDPAQPRKEWIDAVTPNNPVLLSRMDGHGALANSVALKLAGITRDGPTDPPGGAIERDPTTSEPTGILKDTAMQLVSSRVPRTPDRELDAALTAAMREANRYGLTSVHTMSPTNDIPVLVRADRDERLTLRTRVFVMENSWSDAIRGSAYDGTERFEIVGLKLFADGSLGSRTALMVDPYADNTASRKEWRGIVREYIATATHSIGPNTSLVGTEFDRTCRSAVTAGLSPAVHCIGDLANCLVLNQYEAQFGTARSEIGIQKFAKITHGIIRPRIEHAQHLRPSDIPRFAKLGVVASMQPYHKADDGRYAEAAIGPERCKTSYAFRSLLDAGAHVAFGSDWPVVTLNPFTGIHSAVTGRTLDGKTFVPEQNITVAEAIRGYTSGAAYAAGDENHLGKIKAGFAADFVILNQDPFAIPPDELANVTVKETYVAGVRVWPAP